MSFAAQSSMGRSMGRSRLDQSFGASSVRRTGTSGRSKGGARKAKDGGDGPRKLVADPAHPNLVVWDGMRDATPLSLVRTVVGVIAPSDAGMTASSQAISMSGGELAKSGGLTTSMQESLAPSISTSMREGEGSFSDMPGGGSAQHAAGATAEPVPAWSAAGRRADDALTDDEDAVPLTDAELAAPVTILLTETPTFFWLDIEGDVVGKDVQAEHAKTLADNERFRAVQQSRAVASENYSERAAQTFSNEPKVKETMTVPLLTSSMGCQAHRHAIEDAYAAAMATERRHNSAVQAAIALGAVVGGAEGAEKAAAALGASIRNAAGALDEGSSSAHDSLASFGPESSAAALERSGILLGSGVGSGVGGSMVQLDANGTAGDETGRSSSASEAGMASSAQSASTVAPSTTSQQAYSSYTSAALVGHGGGGGGGSTESAEAFARARMAARLAAILNSDAFGSAAATLERMVVQNLLQSKHRIYRDVSLGPDGQPASWTGGVSGGALSGTGLETMLGGLGANSGAGGGALPSTPAGRKGGKAAGGKGAKAGDGPGGAAAGSDAAMADLQELWYFGCEATEGRNVSAVAWNPSAHDVLAAAYGQFEFDAQRPGMVALWALQTPQHPLRMWHLGSGATAVAFSRLQPHLLAIGLYSGMVGVYDVRSSEGKPVSESHPISGKHNEPVWQLTWVDKLGGAGGDENLISVSTDGRVTQWALKKGLERTDLMQLKRLPGVAGATLGRTFAGSLLRDKNDEDGDKKGGRGKEGKNGSDRERPRAAAAAVVDASSAEGGIISRRAAGLSVDFSPIDPSIYICGTEDGSILKCSISYSEQHLEAYSGHRGPVYRLCYSPFVPHVFLSCSADWTVKAWSTEGLNREPLHSFQASMHQVNDVAWSPLSSTVFAAATADGRLDLWDLEASTLDPVATAFVGSPLSAIAFAHVDPVVVAGSKDGRIHVFRVYGPAASSKTRARSLEQQRERLLATIAPNPLAELGLG